MLIIRDLTVQAYSRPTTWWVYRSVKDTVAEICAPDYFANAFGMLAPGNMIVINAFDGNAVRFVTESQIGRVVIAPGM